MAIFIIESRTSARNNWRDDEIGEPNVFATEAEAEAAIESLRQLGEDWADAEYRVVERESDESAAPITNRSITINRAATIAYSESQIGPRQFAAMLPYVHIGARTTARDIASQMRAMSHLYAWSVESGHVQS